MRKQKHQVLLIDDQKELGQVVEMLLGIDGIQLTHAMTGTEGLRLLQQNKFELLILDLGLPDIRGDEILRRLRNDPRYFTFPVIMLTGEQSLNEKVRLFDLGANDFVTKPFHPGELRARTRAVLRTVAAEEAARSKTIFLAHMSHEIRTPMNGIIATSAFLLETPLNERQNTMVQTIQQSGESCLGLLNDILDFSKLEAGKMEFDSKPFNLIEAIEHVFDLMTIKSEEKNLDLVCCVEPGFPEICIGDRLRLQQVFLNLISNAVKFTHKGEVSIHLKRFTSWSSVPSNIVEEIIEEKSALPAAEDFFLGTLHDTGIGMAPEMLAKLFQSYTQAGVSITQNYGGTGLGLAICKSVVEMLGGWIWAESTLGVGSQFHFIIPFIYKPLKGQNPNVVITEADRESLSKVSRIKAPVTWAGKTVLLLETGGAIGEFLTNEIKDMGMEPALISTEDDLNLWLKTNRPHAVVLNENFKEHQTSNLIQTLRQKSGHPDLPVVLLISFGITGFSNEDLQAASIRVPKPVKRSLFRTAWEKLFTGNVNEPKPVPPKQVVESKPKADKLADLYPLSILLADDNQINQHVGMMLLQRLGYTADVVSNGQLALDALAKKEYDLLLLDVQMPVLDGLETANRIRQHEKSPAGSNKPPLIIIAITANAMHGDRDRFIAAGMDDYLSKPITPATFQTAMARWAEHIATRAKTTQVAAPGADSPAPQPLIPAPTPSSLPESDVPTPIINQPAKAMPARTEPIMDIHRFLELAGNDDDVAVELSQQFIIRTTELLPQLGEALSTGNLADAKRIAHGGAGASGTCGMASLATPLRQVEVLSEKGCLQEAKAHFEQACIEFEQVKDFLENKRWR